MLDRILIFQRFDHAANKPLRSFRSGIDGDQLVRAFGRHGDVVQCLMKFSGFRKAVKDISWVRLQQLSALLNFLLGIASWLFLQGVFSRGRILLAANARVCKSAK